MNKKSVLVTGSSRGIGRACAIAFAKAGYHVFINCRQNIALLHSLQDEILSCGGTCTLLPGDVGDPSQVKSMFCQIEKETGGIDILVNNAGIAWFGLLTDMTDEDWSSLLQTNLSSVFYCCRAAIPHMVSVKCGRIINISSMWGTAGASCEAAYSASKGAVNSLTKALAKELAPSHISVNGVSFGVIDTDMNRCFDEEERASLAEEIPYGRFASPEEAAAFLLPDYRIPRISYWARLYALTVDGFDFELPQVRKLCFC